MIRTSVRVGTCVTLGLLMCVSRAAAQSPVRTFAELEGTLKVGQTITIVDDQGRRSQGKVASIAGSQIEILQPTGWHKPEVRVRFAEDAVVRIEHDDSTWNGILIGGAIGTLFGVLTYNDLVDGETGYSLGAFMPLAGGWLGQKLDQHSRRVYYASKRTAPPPVTTEVATAAALVPALEFGTRVRVISSRRATPDRGMSETSGGAVLKTIGTVGNRDSAVLTVIPANDQAVKIPVDSISFVDVSTGKKRNVVPGLLIGLAAGAIVGLAASVDDQDCGSESSNFCSRGAALAMGTSFMGGLGAILGGMTKTDRWVRRYGAASETGVGRSETARFRWSVGPVLRKHSIAVRVSLNPQRD